VETESPGTSTSSPPSVLDIFLSFLRLGAVSFGGPAMVAYIKKLVVTRKKWITQ
jgi:chromate transporter